MVSCYRTKPASVAEGYNSRSTGPGCRFEPTLPGLDHSTWGRFGQTASKGTGLAPLSSGRHEQPVWFQHSLCRGGSRMSRGQWFLFGAVVIGVAVFVYLMFFCPTDCH